jgi:bacterioferritin
MKGYEDLITVLNSILADELNAINQYLVHSEMCENWGYAKLYLAVHGQAMDEIHHSDWLIERNNFIESAPKVSKLFPVTTRKSIAEIFSEDLDLNLKAVNTYNNTIKLVNEIYDQVTDDQLAKIAKTKEGQDDWNHKQSSQLKQITKENYMMNQALN